MKLHVRVFLTCTALFQRFLYSYIWPYKGLYYIFSPADHAKLQGLGVPNEQEGCWVLSSHGKPHSDPPGQVCQVPARTFCTPKGRYLCRNIPQGCARLSICWDCSCRPGRLEMLLFTCCPQPCEALADISSYTVARGCVLQKLQLSASALGLAPRLLCHHSAAEDEKKAAAPVKLRAAAGASWKPPADRAEGRAGCDGGCASSAFTEAAL